MMITDDATVTEQLPQPESEIHEPKIMADPKDDVSVVQEIPQSYAEPKADLSEPDVNVHPEAEVLVAAASASPTNSNPDSSEDDETVNADSHEDPRLYQRSLLTCSDTANDDGVFCGASSDHCPSELEMDDEEVTTVVFSPDHMAYQDRYCIDCVLTFSSSCIKIEGSFLDDDEEPFGFQWGIEDILYIKSHWYQHAGMTMLKIRVLMEDTLQAGNVECPSGTELRFAFIGANWYGKQEAVTSLNDTYKTLWTGIDESGDTVHGHTQTSFPKYFPCFDQPFEEIIYPKGEVDAVSIGKRDVDMLLPDTFVNDTIIDFYIKYLKNKINPEDRPRFHFLNSFFFRKLADPDKEPLEACKGKEAFQRVRKWTRKVNLFEKDYVFIPVNYNYHWSLIVMCHLGEVATYQDEDVTKLSKVPCVLHMDPIRGNHTGLNGLMQSYLKEEWRGRVPETTEDICSRFDNLRFISLELPQQPNSYDCGLFLLHYVELFLEQAPINFNPFKISKSVDFLNMDWFPPADASLKRVVIQRLVYDLLEAPSHEAPPVRVNDDNFHIETAVNFFPETFNNNPSTVCQTSHDDDEIEISLLPSLTMTTEPCPVGPTESLKPTFEPRSFLSMQFPSFNEATFDGYKSSLAPSREMEKVKRMRPTHRRQLEDVPELIHHIQALLPPKDAARTCVLSKSWLHAWSIIPTLRFCQSSESLTEQQEIRYLRLIRRTIRRYHRDNLPIITCDIHFGIRKPKWASLAEKFIKRVASKSSLKELCLTVIDDVRHVTSITLPDEIFSSENLNTLSLKLDFTLDVFHIMESYPLHISSNPLILCVNLRVLELVDVRISHEEVLHNLLSTCKLLEKINLRLPEGLDKIKVNNLLYLHELKIAPGSPCDDARLEICNVPCLCSLAYDAQRICSMPVLSITDSIGSLREIHLTGMTIDLGFCDIINTKFPFLESLTLDISQCWVEILDIRSNSLQRLKISLSNLLTMSLVEVHVYAPKLLSFQYKGFSMPSLFFPTCVPEQIKLTLVVDKPIDHLFFLKLREYLNLSSKFNIVIQSFLSAVLLPFNIDDVRTRVLFPATNVEKLSFEKQFQDDGLVENSILLFDALLENSVLLFDALFSICQPLYVEAHPRMRLKAADYFLKLIDMGVMENKSGNLPDLKCCEIRNGLEGEWETLTSSSLSLVGEWSQCVFKLAY